MKDTELPRIVSRTKLHTGRKFDYEQLVVRSPTGREHTREVVRHPGAVVIVPLLKSARGLEVVLIRVFRASVEAMTWECCAGTLEKGEDPGVCAGRELIEETGYKAGTIRGLGQFRTSPGLSDEMMYAFVGTDLQHVGQDLEEDENIEVHPVPVAEVLGMIDRGEIADGKSLVALLLAQRRGLLG